MVELVNYGYISKQAIYNTVDQLFIWSAIFGYSVEEGGKYCSPFRTDLHPGCRLNRYQNRYLLSDFGNRDYHNIDIVKGIQYKYGLNFIEALSMIADLYINNHMPNTISPIYTKKEHSNFEFYLESKPIPFNIHHKNYFSKRGISKQNLIDDNIEAVNQYRCNSRKDPNTLYNFYTPLGYRINFDSGHQKIVLPKSKIRFVTNGNENDIGGIFDYSRDQLIITKSYKDYRVLKNIGLNVCYTMSEGVLPEKLKEIIVYFKDVIIFYDNDDPGIKAASDLKLFLDNGRIINIPSHLNCKDPDELMVKYGSITDIFQLINKGGV